MDKPVFEVLPLLVAATIGAVALWYFVGDKDQDAIAHGALLGAGVQIGVRLFGVS